jgi:nicotinate dehydrogenase subunit A
MTPMRLVINGQPQDLDVDPDRTVLDVLRHTLDLTGTKYGCGEGQCGACTVLIDNQPVRSCLVRVGAVAGAAITTIEGLTPADGSLHPLQQAFLDHQALQCGYCTPGMIVAAAGLLAAQPNPTDAQIIAALDRNLCRCGTYPRIIAAVRQAAAALVHPGGTP